ncbi:MAG TPA: Os1348 family NHLP clan protein [Chloroflexota bacterium]|nr:Os1348 family NHLP clan protein [Chloroflexota bacterium]
MAIQEVERVMHRALRDEAFRELLRTHPDAALASYELTATEKAALLGRAGPPEPAGAEASQ